MIRVRNLTKKVANRTILTPLSFVAKSGELLAVTGESGSGKSTLLNILGLLEDSFQGTFEIDGQDVLKLSRRQKEKLIRYRISYLFQNYALIPEESVAYNLMLALKYTKSTKKEKQLKVKEALESLDLDYLLEQKIYTLSGGEQQRVSMARTLLKPGNILLADEPTGNLDEANTQVVFRFLAKEADKGKVVIMVTHDQQLAQRCDKIISIHSQRRMEGV